MFDDLTTHVHIMTKLGINANQYLLCILLYCDDRKNGKFIKAGANIANLYKYAESTHWQPKEIADLIDKGLIVDKNRPGSQRSADLLEITPLFEEQVFASISRFNQLWAEYPIIMTTFEGKRLMLKACDKDELEEIYLKRVRTKAKHEKILELVRWGRENKQLFLSIEKFVKGNGWEILEELKKEYSVGGNTTVA